MKQQPQIRPNQNLCCKNTATQPYRRATELSTLPLSELALSRGLGHSAKPLGFSFWFGHFLVP